MGSDSAIDPWRCFLSHNELRLLSFRHNHSTIICRQRKSRHQCHHFNVLISVKMIRKRTYFKSPFQIISTILVRKFVQEKIFNEKKIKIIKKNFLSVRVNIFCQHLLKRLIESKLKNLRSISQFAIRIIAFFDWFCMNWFQQLRTKKRVHITQEINKSK